MHASRASFEHPLGLQQLSGLGLPKGSTFRVQSALDLEDWKNVMA